MNGLPYFKWFPADAETDEDYAAMNDSELGFYHRCLNKSWINTGLPADPKELCRLMKVSVGHLARVWVRVGRKFQLSEITGRLVNPRQERARQEAIGKSESSANAARLSHAKGLRSQNGRSHSAVPRALAGADSDSDFVVGFEVKKSEDGPKSILDDFKEFRLACSEVELPFSDADLVFARIEWFRLDFEQKLCAIKGLHLRKQCGEYDDPGFRPLPQNYLSKRMWERPPRIKQIAESKNNSFWKKVGQS